MSKKSPRNINKPLIFDSQSVFSSVVEQSSKDARRYHQQQQQQQYGWKSFHKQKVELQNIRRQLLSLHVSHRRTMVQATQQLCQQSSIPFTQGHLLNSQQKIEINAKNLLEQRQSKLEDVDQKVALVQKILSERRIKKYYKQKYQTNFQDQLDPEDDQEQIYQFYYQTFGKYKSQPRFQENQEEPMTPQLDHSQQNDLRFVTPQMVSQSNINILPPPTSTQRFNRDPSIRLLPQAMKYNIEIDANKNEDSFDKMKYLPSPTPVHASNKNLNDSLLGVAHDLSFDVKNENQFSKNVPIENLNLNQQSMKKEFRVATEESIEDKEKGGYSEFINKQNEQLQMQKMKVQQLTERATKVLNNDIQEDIDAILKEQQENEEDDKPAQFKYLMNQLVEVYSVGQCLKHILKFKSFEVLNKLYQNASQYYQQNILFKEPLTVKYMSQIIEAALPEEPEKSIKIIINNIFGSEQQLTYEQFIQKLTPTINEKQFIQIEESLVDQINTNILDLTVRLFDVWIELDYFQNCVKELLTNNSEEVCQKFIESCTQDQIFNFNLVSEFLLKSKKITKIKKLKMQIFFRQILGEKPHVSHFNRWYEVRKLNINKSYEQIKEKQQFQYYYNYY